MNATVVFRPSTLKQEGTVGKILRYVQDNPKFVRNTNIVLLTRLICDHYGMKSNTVRTTINKMLNNQMLLRHGGKRHALFYVNYYQKDIPGYILERAPQDIQDKVKAMKANLKNDQYIDEVGCVVTKAKEAPKKEVKEPVEAVEEEPKETQNVVVPVEVKDDAKGLNLTITLNLNINR